MAFSTIKKKRCKCGCGKWPHQGYDGYTKYCAPEKIKERQKDKTKKQISDANKRKLAKVKSLMNSENNLESVVAYMNEGELKEWFRFHMTNSPRRCENCGRSLAHYNLLHWRNSQHHIIDKSPTNGCPSVAANLHNHMVLGYWCCHSQWHTSYMNAQKMKCFPLAKERFQLFKNDIAPSEVKKIPDCFLIDAA